MKTESLIEKLGKCDKGNFDWKLTWKEAGEIIKRLEELEGLREYKRKMVEFDKKVKSVVLKSRE